MYKAVSDLVTISMSDRDDDAGPKNISQNAAVLVSELKIAALFALPATRKPDCPPL